jgi:hypothetical protein
MKKLLKLVVLVVVNILLFSSCGISKAELEKQVGQNVLEYMQENLPSSSGFENLELKSINLFEVGKGQYTGTVVLKYDRTLFGEKLSSEESKHTVSVLTDGKSFQWSIEQ